MNLDQAKLEATLLEMQKTNSHYAYAYGSLSALVEAHLDGRMDEERFAQAADELATAMLNVINPLGPEGPSETLERAAADV